MRTSCNLIVGGAAGQGLDSAALMLARALVRSGWFVLAAQHVMSRVRGGHNNVRLRIAAEPIEAPADTFHLLAAMTEESVALHRGRLAPDAVILVDSAWKLPAEPGLVAIPFHELARRPVYYNTVLLGVISAFLGLEESVLAELLREQFAAKGEDTVAANLEALRHGRQWGEATGVRLSMPDPAPAEQPRLVMNGNQAACLGAVAAGVGFCGYYPMSPSTSLSEALAWAGADAGIVVEQAEDEIAAANMAVGAAYGGARAIVPTSGGGFALMTEAVSLAGIMEAPVVFFVAQRSGPATGLPTRTEQADLDLVLYAGHGEFPRAVFAPDSPESLFRLTYQAFAMAERAQTPVFVLSDEFLADGLFTTEPFSVEGLPPIAEPDLSDTDPEGYERYSLRMGPVPPRRIPGAGRSLVLWDSHEHEPSGHITESAEIRVAQQDRRLQKLSVLKEQVVPPAYLGPENPDVLLVSWGSPNGAVRETVSTHEGPGTLAALTFTQVWPLVPETFLPYLTAARRVVVVEGNSTGQFARLLTWAAGFSAPHAIRRYDGRAMTVQYIRQGLRSLLEG